MNTTMDISIDWDVELIKNETSAKLNYVYNCVFGTFSWEEKKDSYKKIITISFHTDLTWKINEDILKPLDSRMYEKDVSSPLGAKINFDEKTIKIY